MSMRTYCYRLILFLACTLSFILVKFSSESEEDLESLEIRTGDDSLIENSAKWSINLNDMLNFDKYLAHSLNGNEMELNLNGKLREKYQNLNGKTGMNQGKEDWKLTEIKKYILRFVNLYLYLLNLKDKKISGADNSEVIVHFDFVVTAKDLKTLQNLSENINEGNILDQLNTIDFILSKSLHLREEISFYERIFSVINFDLSFSKDWLIAKQTYYNFFLITTVVLIFMKRYMGYSTVSVTVMLLNNLILLEGVISYLHKLKEAEIKDHVEILRSKNKLDTCLSTEPSFFGKVWYWFAEDECFTYHRVMELKTADKIFPLESIFDTYCFYLIKMPSKIIGSAISTFSSSCNEYLPVIVRPFGTFGTIFIVLLFIFSFLICWLRPRLRLNFWGARAEFGFQLPSNEDRILPPRIEPVEYYRILELPGTPVKKSERISAVHSTDNEDKGSDPVSKILNYARKEDNIKVEKSRLEEINETEIIDECSKSDVSKEASLSQDFKTAKTILAALKTSE